LASTRALFLLTASTASGVILGRFGQSGLQRDWRNFGPVWAVRAGERLATAFAESFQRPALRKMSKRNKKCLPIAGLFSTSEAAACLCVLKNKSVITHVHLLLDFVVVFIPANCSKQYCPKMMPKFRFFFTRYDTFS
jgi:hypothetical protein